MNFNIAAHTELMHFLSESDEMRTTASSSLKQGLWAGSLAVTGGLMLGPLGGMLGGIVGSVVGWWNSDNYDGAINALNNLEYARREIILSEITEILIKAGALANNLSIAGGLTTALQEFATQPAVRDNIWKACVGVSRN